MPCKSTLLIIPMIAFSIAAFLLANNQVNGTEKYGERPPKHQNYAGLSVKRALKKSSQKWNIPFIKANTKYYNVNNESFKAAIQQLTGKPGDLVEGQPLETNIGKSAGRVEEQQSLETNTKYYNVDKEAFKTTMQQLTGKPGGIVEEQLPMDPQQSFPQIPSAGNSWVNQQIMNRLATSGMLHGLSALQQQGYAQQPDIHQEAAQYEIEMMPSDDSSQTLTNQFAAEQGRVILNSFDQQPIGQNTQADYETWTNLPQHQGFQPNQPAHPQQLMDDYQLNDSPQNWSTAEQDQMQMISAATQQSDFHLLQVPAQHGTGTNVPSIANKTPTSIVRNMCIDGTDQKIFNELSNGDVECMICKANEEIKYTFKRMVDHLQNRHKGTKECKQFLELDRPRREKKIGKSLIRVNNEAHQQQTAEPNNGSGALMSSQVAQPTEQQQTMPSSSSTSIATDLKISPDNGIVVFSNFNGTSNTSLAMMMSEIRIRNNGKIEQQFHVRSTNSAMFYILPDNGIVYPGKQEIIMLTLRDKSISLDEAKIIVKVSNSLKEKKEWTFMARDGR